MAVKKVKSGSTQFAKVVEPVKLVKNVPAKKGNGEAIMPQQTKSDSFIVIDYPSKGEVISGIHYAIRIGASHNGRPQISFDGNNWKPCRHCAGYWWYDWSYFTPGTHRIYARLLENSSGKVVKELALTCKAK